MFFPPEQQQYPSKMLVFLRHEEKSPGSLFWNPLGTIHTPNDARRMCVKDIRHLYLSNSQAPFKGYFAVVKTTESCCLTLLGDSSDQRLDVQFSSVVYRDIWAYSLKFVLNRYGIEATLHKHDTVIVEK